MKKSGKILFVFSIVICMFILCGLLVDNHMLQENLIRLHIVANSDTVDDQDNKLVVRDAVLLYLQENTGNIATVSEARDFLQKNKMHIEAVVNQSLANVGAPYSGKVSLVQEEFSKRVYDTFSLPSGIYHSLRIELGEGQGKNWWCVAFPALCMVDTAEGFRGAAIEAGFQENLVDTISRDNYEIRFFLLDCFGKIENFFNFE